MTLGLQIESVTDISTNDLWRGDLFSIVVAATPDKPQKAYARLTRMAGLLRAQDYGILLAICSPKNDLSSDVEARVAVALGRAKSNIRVIRWDTSEFAEAMRVHNPGLAANRALNIQQLDSEDQKDDVLLRRAFSRFQDLILEELEGGRSDGCKIWKVEARHGPSIACEPFVAKAAGREALMEERSTYLHMVRDSIPFPFQAPMLDGMFVEGAERALLVSAFVNHASRLDDYLAAPSSPAMVIASLFEKALGPRRREFTREHVSLGVRYVNEEATNTASRQPRFSLLPAPGRLISAFEDAVARRSSLPNPTQLWLLLRQLPVKEHRFCFIHGDLNARNVFVRWNAIDTVLIDFSHCGMQDSLARDPAKLDTSIALSVGKSEDKLLTELELRRIYAVPLLAQLTVVPKDNRLEAVRQIRRHAAADGISDYEYSVLVACHLLRYSRAPGGSNGDTPTLRFRRSVAYEIATDLLNNSLAV
jgi:hypothetical protein